MPTTKPTSLKRLSLQSILWAAPGLLLIAFCATTALAGPTVSLQERVVVEGTVTLGDIAEIEAEKDTEIESVIIGSSPLAGRTRTVSAGYVRMRIARADFEDFTIEGADHVELVGAGVRKSGSTTRQTDRQSMDEDAEPPPPVIHRSQRVQVTLINHGVIISAAGRAMADAPLNAPVPVRISSTGQQIQGIAADQERVIVRLGRRSR